MSIFALNVPGAIGPNYKCASVGPKCELPQVGTLLAHFVRSPVTLDHFSAQCTFYKVKRTLRDIRRLCACIANLRLHRVSIGTMWLIQAQKFAREPGDKKICAK